MRYKVTLRSESEERTREIGQFFAGLLKPGDVVLLKGDLGAGKTSFVKGAALGLGVTERVISPTFNIMKCYFGGRLPLYHIDAYRLEGQNIEIGLDECIEGDGVSFVEWPDYIAPLIPDDPIEIVIARVSDNARLLTISSVRKDDIEKLECLNA